jgi:hypothetical protein
MLSLFDPMFWKEKLQWVLQHNIFFRCISSTVSTWWVRLLSIIKVAEIILSIHNMVCDEKIDVD